MKGHTSIQQIRRRLDVSKDLLAYHRKIEVLRRVTHGDYSEFEPDAPVQNEDYSRRKEPAQRAFSERMEEIFTRGFAPGRSNLIAKTIRNLTIRSSFKLPEFRVEGDQPRLEMLTSLYLREIFMRCNAQRHMQRALTDFLIGGFGVCGVGLRAGEPVAFYLDPLDCVWDPHVQTFEDCTWFAFQVTKPLALWVEELGTTAPFRDLLDATGDERLLALEKPVRLTYYFDTHGDEGTYALMRWKDSDDYEMVEGPMPTPYVDQRDGYPRPFLPVVTTSFMLMPQTRYASGLVELMLPHGVQLRQSEGMLERLTAQGHSITAFHEDSIDENDLAAIQDGDSLAWIRIKQKGAIERIPHADLPPSIGAVFERAEKAITAMGGDNPFASGGTVPGTRFASEVAAIQNESGLIGSHVVEEHALHWSRLAERVLQLAPAHTRPFYLLVDGEKLWFDNDQPIADLLVPDCRPQVRPESLMYRSPQEEMSVLLPLLQQSQSLAVAQAAPGSVAELWRKVLQASGERNVSAHFEPPMAPGVGATGLSEGGQQAAMM